MLITRNLSLNSTPTVITVDNEIDASNSMVIQNTSISQNVYVGGSTVSSTNYGFRLYPAQTITMDLTPYETIYAVGDTGATVAVLILDQP